MITNRVKGENLGVPAKKIKATKEISKNTLPKSFLTSRHAKKDNNLHYCLNKKGQEEILGFILVVVMVVVIGLAFLFFLTPRAQERQDLEMENLLYAWLSTTIEEGKDVSSMIDDCYGCDLNSSASILNSAMSTSGLINRINGYSLTVNGTTEFYYSQGNLTGNTRTAYIPLKENEVRLKFYLP